MEPPIVAAFRFALDAAAKATFLLAAGSLALLLLRRRPAAVRHLAGTLAIAAALLAPALAPVLPRVRLPLLPAVAGERPETLPDFEAPLPAPARRSPPVEASEPAPGAEPEAGLVAASAAAPEELFSSLAAAPRSREPLVVPVAAMAAALAVWLAGTVVSLARLAVGVRRVRRVVRTGMPVADPEWKALGGELGREIGLDRPVRLLWSDRLPVAVAAGARRPALILPTAARQWDAARRRVVLLHELAHVARRDGFALLVLEVGLAAYWFQPLAWILARRLRRDAERAADDRVLAAGTKPSVYAGHLLGIIRALRGDGPAIPALGVARPSHFEERLRAILAPDVRRRAVTRPQARGAVAAAFVAAAALAAVQPWTAGRSEAALPSMSAGEDAPPPKLVAASRGGRARSAKPAKAPCPAKRRGGSPPAMQTFTGRVVLAAPAPIEAKPEKDGKAAYRSAWNLYKQGRYADAVAGFARAHAAGFRPDFSAYNAACALSLAGDADAAFGWLERASAAGFDVLAHLGSDDDLAAVRADARFEAWRARLLAAAPESGEAAAAVKRLDDLARRFPDDADDLFGVGKRLLDAERFDLAARAFELSARAGQRPGPSLYDAGCARARAGDVDGAFDTLRRALAAGFDEPELLRDDEDLAAIRGDPRFAELVATAEALALRPSDEAEDWAAASARYAEYTAAHPELGRAWFNLGYARLAADDAAGAVEAFEEALARRYRTATTMYDLACSNARLGRKDEAFAYLFESLHRGLDAEALLTRDHAWKALRADPRFAQALALAKTDRDAAD